MTNKTLEKIAGIATAVALPLVAIAATIYISNKDLAENNGKVVPIGHTSETFFSTIYDSDRDGNPDYVKVGTFLVTPATPVKFIREPRQDEIDWYKSH